MIELRWIERIVPAPEYGPNIGKTGRILQFRQVESEMNIRDGKPMPCHSEWQDVPVVKAD